MRLEKGRLGCSMPGPSLPFGAYFAFRPSAPRFPSVLLCSCKIENTDGTRKGKVVYLPYNVGLR